MATSYKSIDDGGTDVGGHVVLNFVNTCGGADKRRDGERLTDWETAIDWATAHGLIDPAELRPMEKTRRKEERDPSDLLDELRDLRETVHTVLSALAGGMPVPQAARVRLEGYVIDAVKHAELRLNGHEPASWVVVPEKAGSALMKDRLALAANALLGQPVIANVRECAACSWLFLDLSKSKSRRWCSMATCGNRAKAQRHYRAMKESG